MASILLPPQAISVLSMEILLYGPAPLLCDAFNKLVVTIKVDSVMGPLQINNYMLQVVCFWYNGIIKVIVSNLTVGFDRNISIIA